MELVETITDVPEFDKAWVEFCQYYNAPNAECVPHAKVTTIANELTQHHILQ